jgi:hypothetical protein
VAATVGPTAPRFTTGPGGWSFNVAGNYAQPATAGGGYIEVQNDGAFEVAVETDQSAQDMGVDSFLVTKVPVAVIRELLAHFDAKAGT